MLRNSFTFALTKTKYMKKLYFILSLVSVSAFTFAQRANTSVGTNLEFNLPSSSSRVIVDTLSNVESDDTLAIYPRANWGYLFGHNDYNDMGWAEKYYITGQTGTVLGGAYYLYANTINTPTDYGFGQVYTVGTDGLPDALLATDTVPYSTIPLGGTDLTYFSFSSPVAVADSFFMAWTVPAYTTTDDTVGIITTRDGNRSMGTYGQNAAMWNDGSWYDELTANWGAQLTYVLMPIIDLAISTEVKHAGLTISKAYPNPASSSITVPFSVETEGSAVITVIGMNGKVISSETINAGKGANTYNVDVTSLPSGSYFYSVSSNNGRIFSKFEVIK